MGTYPRTERLRVAPMTRAYRSVVLDTRDSDTNITFAFRIILAAGLARLTSSLLAGKPLCSTHAESTHIHPANCHHERSSDEQVLQALKETGAAMIWQQSLSYCRGRRNILFRGCWVTCEAHQTRDNPIHSDGSPYSV